MNWINAWKPGPMVRSEEMAPMPSTTAQVTALPSAGPVAAPQPRWVTSGPVDLGPLTPGSARRAARRRRLRAASELRACATRTRAASTVVAPVTRLARPSLRGGILELVFAASLSDAVLDSTSVPLVVSEGGATRHVATLQGVRASGRTLKGRASFLRSAPSREIEQDLRDQLRPYVAVTFEGGRPRQATLIPWPERGNINPK